MYVQLGRVRAYHPGHVASATGAAAAGAGVPARAGTRSIGERGARRARGGAGGLGGEALGEAEAHVFCFVRGVGGRCGRGGCGTRRQTTRRSSRARARLGSMTSPSDARDTCDYLLNERHHMTENRLGLVSRRAQVAPFGVGHRCSSSAHVLLSCGYCEDKGTQGTTICGCL
jgi:hypothetical protein